MKPTKLICCECGSDEIYANATVQWDIDAQDWIAGEVDDLFCNGCDSQVEAEWVDIDEEAA